MPLGALTSNVLGQLVGRRAGSRLAAGGGQLCAGDGTAAASAGLQLQSRSVC